MSPPWSLQRPSLPQEYDFLSDLEEGKSECTVWCAPLTYYKQSARHNAKACEYITVAQIVPLLPPSSLYEGRENPRWNQSPWLDLTAWAGRGKRQSRCVNICREAALPHNFRLQSATGGRTTTPTNPRADSFPLLSLS